MICHRRETASKGMVIVMSKFLKKAAAVIVSAVMMLSVSACGEDPASGNLGDVKLEENDVYAVIKIMDYGEITAKLFPTAAPESVKRFTEFAEMGYYDGKTIHRVIKDYMIQGGSLNGDGSDGNVPETQYVPVEASSAAFNFYGALCFAASKKGSYSQFYIVANHEPQDIDGVISKLTSQLGDEALAARLTEEDKKYYQDYLDKLKAIPQEVKEKYARVGGLYELDGTNTVFGQVIDGFDVLKEITNVEVVSGNKMDDKVNTPSKPIDSIVIESIKIVHIEPEVTEETTTTKKSSKTTKKKTEVNAETLPPAETSDTAGAAESNEDTTSPADGSDAAVGDTETVQDNAGEEAETGEGTAGEEAASGTQEDASDGLMTEVSEGGDVDEEEIILVDE